MRQAKESPSMNCPRPFGLPVRLIAFSMLAACLSIATLGVSAASAQTKGPRGPLQLLPFIGHGVMVWGGNTAGQLGDGTTKNRPTPTELPNFADGAVGVSGGGWHTLLVKADGSPWSVGSNSGGQL